MVKRHLARFTRWQLDDTLWTNKSVSFRRVVLLSTPGASPQTGSREMSGRAHERTSASSWFCTKDLGNSGHTWQKRWELQPLLISGGGTGLIPRVWVPAWRGG